MPYIDPGSDAYVVIGLADDVPATLAVEIRSGAAHAANNDTWQDATPIEQTPFIDRVDLTAATGSADDPTTCGGSQHTVWYRIRPAHRIRLEVRTLGVAPVVWILRRASVSFVTLRCVQSDVESANLQWTFAGGVTTYIVVGLQEGAVGGPPGDVSLTIPNDPIPPKPPWETAPTTKSNAPLPATATVGSGPPPSPSEPGPASIVIVVGAGLAAVVVASRRARRRVG
jgi:hypothetical protein